MPETVVSGFRGTIEWMAGYEHRWDAAGMESTSDVGDLTGVQGAYDTVAADYAKHLPDTRAEAPLDLAMIDEFTGIVTNAEGRVLDAGCGTGRMSRYLADHGCDVRGLDLSPGMIKMARQQHPDLTFTVGSLTDLPYPDHHFGLS